MAHAYAVYIAKRQARWDSCPEALSAISKCTVRSASVDALHCLSPPSDVYFTVFWLWASHLRSDCLYRTEAGAVP